MEVDPHPQPNAHAKLGRKISTTKPHSNPFQCNTLPAKYLNAILYSHKIDNPQRISNIERPNRMNTLPATPLNRILYKNRGGGGGTPPPNVSCRVYPQSYTASLTGNPRIQAFVT